VPVAAVPPPVALVSPVFEAGVTAALEDEEAAEDEDEADDVLAALVSVVEVVALAWVEVAATEAACPVVGTVSGGAPEVSALDGVELPPQAASPRAARVPRSSAANVAIERLMVDVRTSSGIQRLHTPAAVWAVVQVLLAQLVAPVAEAQVFHRPRQLGGCRRKR
jgi:hypothetical protein